MRVEINDGVLDQVVGGTVRLNTTRMRLGFTVLHEAYDLKNCTDIEAMNLVTAIYAQYRTAGDRAFEEATKAAFEAKGWI